MLVVYPPLEREDCGKEVSVVWVIDSDAKRERVGGRRGAQPPQPFHVLTLATQPLATTHNLITPNINQ
jgi:hypothetical protein